MSFMPCVLRCRANERKNRITYKERAEARTERLLSRPWLANGGKGGELATHGAQGVVDEPQSLILHGLSEVLGCGGVSVESPHDVLAEVEAESLPECARVGGATLAEDDRKEVSELRPARLVVAGVAQGAMPLCVIPHEPPGEASHLEGVAGRVARLTLQAPQVLVALGPRHVAEEDAKVKPLPLPRRCTIQAADRGLSRAPPPLHPPLVLVVPAVCPRDVCVEDCGGARVGPVELEPRSELRVWRPRGDHGGQVCVTLKRHVLLVLQVVLEAHDAVRRIVDREGKQPPGGLRGRHVTPLLILFHLVPLLLRPLPVALDAHRDTV